jgi:hypothetical protein
VARDATYYPFPVNHVSTKPRDGQALDGTHRSDCRIRRRAPRSCVREALRHVTGSRALQEHHSVGRHTFATPHKAETLGGRRFHPYRLGWHAEGSREIALHVLAGG